MKQLKNWLTKLFTALAILIAMSRGLYAQTQNNVWSLPPYYLNHVSGLVHALPLGPNASDYAGQTAQYTHNMIQTGMGTPLFFVVDNVVYDRDGYLIDYFVGGTAEMVIVPDPFNCLRYYLIAGNRGPGLSNKLPYYAILDLGEPSFYYPGRYGALQNTGSGTANSIAALIPFPDKFEEVANKQGGLFIAASKVRSDNTRFVFISNGFRFFRFKIDQTGFHYDGYKCSAWPAQYNMELRGEMELAELPGGHYRIAVPFEDAIPGIFTAELDNNGALIAGTENSLLFTPATGEPTEPYPHGLEFSPDGNILYITHNASLLHPSPFEYFNFSSPTSGVQPLAVTNAIDFQSSQIELGRNGKLYLPTGNRFATLANPNSPNVSNWVDVAKTITYGVNYEGSSSVNYQLKSYMMPDQIDGMDYHAAFFLGADISNICRGASVHLGKNCAIPGATYSWSSVPAGGPYPNTSSINVNPTVNTTYTLTITLGPLYYHDQIDVTVSPCNLVRNGCFEGYSTLPTGIDQLANVDFWGTYGTGVADYLNSDATNPAVTIPQNGQFARGGKGMVALQCRGNDDRDYLSQQLETPLGNGTYYAEMYVNLSKAGDLAINSMVMHFTQNYTPRFDNEPLLSLPLPRIPASGGSPTNLCYGWTKVAGIFTYTGGTPLKYLIIGNVNADGLAASCPGGSTSTISTYFIDDVLLEKMEANAGVDKTITCGGAGTTIGTAVSPCSAIFSYSWSPATGITGSLTSPAVVANPVTTTTYTLTVTISTPDGPQSITDQVTVTVNPAVAVTCTTCNLTTCFNVSSINLSSSLPASPAGGTYSGPHVNPATGTFNNGAAIAAGGGSFTIQYTIGGPGACQSSVNMTVNVPGACDWAWQTKGAGASDNYSNAVANDPVTGDTYITGNYSESIDFGNGVSLSGHVNGFYIAKYSNCGVIQWAKTVTSLPGTNTSSGLGISVDAGGNAYVTGKFKGSFNLGLTTLTSLGSGTEDLFIAKYSSGGIIQWYVKGGGTSDDAGMSIVVDPLSTDILLTGYVQGLASLDYLPSGSLTLPFNLPFKNVFVARYTAAGNIVWGRNYDGLAASSGNGIAMDKSNWDNVYVTGSFNNRVIFATSPVTIQANAAGGTGTQSFLLRMNKNTTPVWAVNALQVTNGSASISNSVASDVNGNAYITGGFVGTINVGGTSLANVVGLSGPRDIFTAKYSNSGGLLWALRDGGTMDDEGRSICTDNSNNAYTSGFFKGTATIDGTALTGFGLRDVYVAKYHTTAGSPIGITKKFGGVNDDQGNGITIDLFGNCFITGSFMTSSAAFGTVAPVVLSTPTLNHDGFLKKMCNAVSSFKTGELTGDAEAAATENENGLLVYPNPTSGFLTIEWLPELEGSLDIRITDVTGKTVYQKTIEKATAGLEHADIRDLSPGIYLVCVTGQNIKKNIKLIKQ
jgi:hypothetical protein